MRGSLLGLFAFAFACTLAASCSSFEASDEPPVPTPTEAGPDVAVACSNDLARDPNNCGQCGKVCSPAEACEGGGCRPGCADKKIHVSITTGDDTNDGCTPTRPMKTIGAAIARAKAIGAIDHEVAVCRGAYPVRGLVVDYPVSVRGGYECSSFTRTKDFGYPTFDGATETILDDANEGADRTTLTIMTAVVTRTTIIDGFTINGALTGAAESVAVAITGGASPTLRDLKIEGGGTTAPSGIGSRGLLTRMSTPEISGSQIRGGSGVAGDGGLDVVGVHVRGGAPILHDLKVIGTPTVARPRVNALYVSGAAESVGPNAWHDISVSAGLATVSGVGLSVTEGSNVEVTRSDLAGPFVTCPLPQCSGIGLLVSAAAATVERSRIFGGEGAGPWPLLYGTYVSSYPDVRPSVLVNNTIVGGNTARRTEPRVIGAIFIQTNGGRFAHNTVLLAEPVGVPAYPTTGIYVTTGAVKVEVDNNLVVAERGINAAGLHLDRDCGLAQSTFRSARGNAFVGVSRVLDYYSDEVSACQLSSISTVTDAQAKLTALGFPATNNVRLGTDCANDPVPGVCQICLPASACAPAVVSPWTAGASPSVAELFAPTSYVLPATTPCLVSSTALALVPPVPLDVTGKARGTKPSIGAFDLAKDCP